MDRHLYKSILEIFLWSTTQNCNMDPSRLVFRHDNDPKHTSKIMQKWLASQPFQLLQWLAQSPNLNPIGHLWALLEWRLNKFTTRTRGIQECGSVCVQCIPISMNRGAWRYMRACHKELTLCWRIGVTRPITEEFVNNLNLNKTEYLYIVSHLALQHTFLLSM
jgi:hypothetical protein